jgi:hypothetical protein
MSRIRRLIASLLVVSVAGTFISFPAQAAIVATDSVATSAAASADRARIAQALARDDVRAELQARGVNPADVQARVDALSDDEAAQLAQKIDTLPAGGDVLGLIVFVFIVLLITDILGLTKVFPFTRPIK